MQKYSGAASRPGWDRPEPGTYLLLLYLPEPARVAVGRLGEVAFETSWYIYIGSALGGLGARLRRHARPSKPLRWHIDALRQVADLAAIAFRLGSDRQECTVAKLVKTLPGARPGPPAFGSSDCRCRSHLLAFSSQPELQLSAEWEVGYLPGSLSPAAGEEFLTERQ